MIIGFVNGCFDVLHMGHIELLKYAKSQCDYLIVATDTDEKIRAAKGPNRPFNKLEDRIGMLGAIKYVDDVKSFASRQELENLLILIKPDVMFVGSDYKGKHVVGSESAKKLIIFERIDGYSTTKILESSAGR